MTETVDVVIIGAGSAGLAALSEVKKRTQNVIIINDGAWGTTCARVGCMPSKLLIEAANAFHHRGTFEEFGIQGADQLTVDRSAVLRRVRRLRDDFVASTLKATDRLGERAITGRARLLGPNRVQVNGREIVARQIIIATGSRPAVPAPWRALGARVQTTDTLFEQTTLPDRMAVVGLGPLGVELAQAISRLGVNVAAFGRNPLVAGLTDPDVNTVALKSLSREFAIHLGADAELTATANGVRVSAGAHTVDVDQVLVALGRRPNIDDLGLETLGVALNDKGMPKIDRTTLQIADLPIFLAGDANAERPLLHEAADDGHIAGINVTQPTVTCYARRTSLAIVFAEPGMAMVGSSFSALDTTSCITSAVDFSHQGRALAGQRNTGLIRLYASAQSGRLLGAEMCAPAAEHMAHLLALAIDQALTVHDMLRMPFYHPVLEEGLRNALRGLAKQLPTTAGFDLAHCESLHIEALE
ncbi:dihydrolipoamide dehydrogenase [Rugosibacter aromaticivorans]|uniref:Dihydrolipoamide dehydrogenase n=1 Tax=Rugosibacter aromaticivorans TaxID=1565605 RepID=A0A0C5JAW7_9PROT|nr:dihydrolipoyl dehydrogenase [Rugosibacter aromaticivorans]AJP48879.1 dihydrolipoamide dehydrogenase [Rugosibacter aromaticivorans]ART37157.1 D151 [uncultured bacterium]TBR13579.1 MAG: dihydrolipoyl dehydrogenase [Rugosibacter sp.]